MIAFVLLIDREPDQILLDCFCTHVLARLHAQHVRQKTNKHGTRRDFLVCFCTVYLLAGVLASLASLARLLAGLACQLLLAGLACEPRLLAGLKYLLGEPKRSQS